MTEYVLPGSEVTFLLADVTRLWRHAFEGALAKKDIGLTPSEVRALVYVARMDGSKQRLLADAMGIEPMTVSSAINTLEEAGLVRRETDPFDRRAKRIFLTPASQGLLDAVAPIAAQTFRTAMMYIEEDRANSFISTLKVLRNNFGSP